MQGDNRYGITADGRASRMGGAAIAMVGITASMASILPAIKELQGNAVSSPELASFGQKIIDSVGFVKDKVEDLAQAAADKAPTALSYMQDISDAVGGVSDPDATLMTAATAVAVSGATLMYQGARDNMGHYDPKTSSDSDLSPEPGVG